MELELSVHQRRFEAAVKVMRTLPADGVFVPSDDMLIRFHSFHQQATAGVCSSSKPCSLNTLRKAKWKAWRALGDMSKEEAMQAYVEEILLILEMIPVTEEVSDLLEALEPFYEVVEDEDDDGDDETFSKPAMTPFSGSSEEWRGSSAGNGDDDVEEDDDYAEDNDDVREAEQPCDESVSAVYGDLEGSERPEDRDGNTKDESVSQDGEPHGAAPPPLCTVAHGAVQSVILSAERGRGRPVSHYRNIEQVSLEHMGVNPVNTQILLVLSRLQDDMRSVVARLNVLEARAVAQVEKLALRSAPHTAKVRLLVYPAAMSQISVAFLLVWPFVAHVLVQLYLKKKRKTKL